MSEPTKPNDGGPAMNATMRDYFAMGVLSGMAASEMWSTNFQTGKAEHDKWRADVVAAAYAVADAMLEARKK